MPKKKSDHTVMSKDTAEDLLQQFATVADLYVLPPQLKVDVHEWSGYYFEQKSGKPVGKMKHWIDKVSVEPSGDWGEYDGAKIAKAMEKAAKREINRQAKQYIGRKTQEKTNGT